MPNWCAGTLRVRGTKENLTKFVLEGLQPVRHFFPRSYRFYNCLLAIIAIRTNNCNLHTYSM